MNPADDEFPQRGRRERLTARDGRVYTKAVCEEVVLTMRYAIKSKCKRLKAYELGAGSDMEKRLLREGVIRPTGDGRYLLFSKEAVNGVGEAAREGDFFKVDEIDDRRYAYPNDRTWFLEHHRHIEGDEYEQVNRPLPVWRVGDPMDEEIDYLVRTERLHIAPEDGAHCFRAFLWGAPLSAARDATVVFYRVDRDGQGRIADVDFGLVDRLSFEENYVFCDAQGNPV